MTTRQIPRTGVDKIPAGGVPLDQVHPGPDHGETAAKRISAGQGGLPRNDPNGLGSRSPLGNGPNLTPRHRSCSRLEPANELVQRGGPLGRVPPDAITGAGEIVLDPPPGHGLQRCVAVEPQFVGEPDDGRSARTDPVGKIGHSPEREQSRLGDHNLSDAALRGGQLPTRSGDQFREPSSAQANRAALQLP